MTFLLFSPLYALILLTNLAPLGKWWRLIPQLIAVAINLLLVAGGTLFGIGWLIQAEGLLNSLPNGADILAFGIGLALTGIVGLGLMVQRVRALLYPLLRWKMEAENTIHTIAVEMAIWAMGGNLASIFLGRTVAAENLTANGSSPSLLGIWEQGAIFVLLAILGVGWGLRRGWKESLERLGIGWLSPIQILLLPALVIGLLLIQVGIIQLWEFTDPASLARINELSGTLFNEETMSLAGALTIGLSAGIGEELLIRGAVQPRFGILFTTFLFATLHTQYEFSFATLIVLVVGLVLGVVRQYVNTTACIIIHAGYNALLVLANLANAS